MEKIKKEFEILDFKPIETTYFNGTQSVEFKGIYEYTPNRGIKHAYKIKVHIDVDAYSDQSSAKVWVFNSHDLEWKTLDSIPYQHMTSLQKDERDLEAVFYQTKVGDSEGNGLSFKEYEALSEDINDLLFKAKNIL